MTTLIPSRSAGTRWFFNASASALIVATLAPAGLAATRHVPADYPTIQAAINASADGDEIILADGAYAGVGNRDLAVSGRALTVRSAGGPDACQIDVGGPNRGFDLGAADGGMQIEGITFTDSGYGGVAIVVASTATVTDCVFEGFSNAGINGAVFTTGAPTFIGCTFRDNTGYDDQCSGSDARGAAIFSDGGSLTILDSHFEGNIVSGGACAGLGYGEGGAIWARDTSIVIERTEFVSNRSMWDGKFGYAYGGAVYLDGGSLVMAGCTFDGNRCGPDGVGAAILASDASVTARDCAFTNNEWAGAVDLWGSSAQFVHCRFQGNDEIESASPFDEPLSEAITGAAIDSDAASDVSLIGCLLTGNTVSAFPQGIPVRGGAIRVHGSAEIVLCTIADNATGPPIYVGANGLVTVRNSIIQTMEPSSFGGPGSVDAHLNFITGTVPTPDCPKPPCLPGFNLDLDPGFVDPAGGDYRLALDSPAIDFADLAFLPADTLDADDDGDVLEPLPVDLDGEARVVDVLVGGGSLDLGAYENQGPSISDCPDLDGDGGVGFGDLTMLLTGWGTCDGPCAGDLDGDGSVGFNDLTTLLFAWGPCN